MKQLGIPNYSNNKVKRVIFDKFISKLIVRGIIQISVKVNHCSAIKICHFKCALFILKKPIFRDKFLICLNTFLKKEK